MRRLAVAGALVGLACGVVAAGGVVSSPPASAAPIVNRCNIVANPTPTNRTNCPHANLAGANLSGLNLAYANFFDGNLKGANLSNTNLTKANLSDVNLKGANISNSDLTQANLSDANLKGVDFSNSKLVQANLSDSDLGGAHLGGANLSGAKVKGTNLKGFFAATVMPDGSIKSTGSTIKVSPSTASVPNGLTQGFDAIATYSDGTNVLLKNNVTWSSLNAQVATVASTGLAKGVVPNAPYNVANFPKTATIKAAAGSASGTAALTVGPPNLASVVVTPATAAIVLGNTQPFSATGTYSDASTAPLAGVAWSSDTPSVATVDNAGLATGGGTGTATITATSGPLSGSATLAVVDALTITTASPLPVGVQGSQYSQTLAAAGGVGPYTWSKASGAVPPGLTLNANGTLTGTPTAAGAFNLVVKASDAGPPAQSNTKALQIEVKPPLGITTNSLATGVVGSSLSQALAADGGITPYSWSLTPGSNLPAGLTLNASTGVISGAPTAAGTFNFIVRVTDSQSPAGSATKPLSIAVASHLNSTSNFLFGNLQVGQALPTFTPLEVSGGTPPYTWAVTAGSIPPGLTLNATTGLLSGTPTISGTFTSTIDASDNGNPAQKASRTLELKVAGPLSITTTSLPDGQVPGLFGCFPGPCYSATLAGTGGVGPPYLWSLATGSSLPPGLSLDATTGLISGNPTTAGTFPFTVELAQFGQPFPPVSKALSIKIAAAPPSIDALFLNNAVNGSPYSATLSVTGGAAPFTWSLAGGILPVGLNLNSATGEISGTPTTTGTSSFTVKVTDASTSPQSATKDLSINVVTPVTITTTSLPQADLGNSFYDATLTATGGQPDYGWSVVVGGLPPGLTLNAATGHITGSASVAGTFTFTVQAKDFGFPNAQTASKQLTLTAFGITTGSLPGATQGSAYHAQVRASGGTPPYLFGGVMPPGLVIDLNTGVISGTPTTAGIFTINVGVCAPITSCFLNKPDAVHATRQFILTVAQGVAPLSITTTSPLPNAHQFAGYSEYVGVTGGTGPYTWSIIAGELPPGMVLESSTGEIHNAPGVAAVTYNFTVQVTDSGSPQLTTTRAFSITVDSCFFCGG